jgi:hypothetical protein
MFCCSARRRSLASSRFTRQRSYSFVPGALPRDWQKASSCWASFSGPTSQPPSVDVTNAEAKKKELRCALRSPMFSGIKKRLFQLQELTFKERALDTEIRNPLPFDPDFSKIAGLYPRCARRAGLLRRLPLQPLPRHERQSHVGQADLGRAVHGQSSRRSGQGGKPAQQGGHEAENNHYAPVGRNRRWARLTPLRKRNRVTSSEPDDDTPSHRTGAGVRYSKSGCSTSDVGHFRPGQLALPASRCPPHSKCD